MSDICSVSVEGLGRLLAAMRSGHRSLSSDLQPLHARMRAHGVTLAAFRDIDRIACWVEDQLPALERRRNMAIGLIGDRPAEMFADLAGGSRFGTPAEAETYGRELADRLINASTVTEALFDELLEEFERYATDPDVMAGFYLRLGPGRAELLANQLTSTGSPRGARHLETFSVGLGTALSATDSMSGTADYYTDLAGFRRHFTQPVDDPRSAWSRMAILQHGDFPPGWLAETVSASVLRHLADDGKHAGAYDHSLHTDQLGLSSDALALAFGSLANNPAAARLALGTRSGQPVSEYVDRVFQLVDGLAVDPTTAFGQALAAGSGALDEPPDTGRHASSFAFDAIVALGRHEWPPIQMGEPMGRIAAAYAEEILVGSYEHAPGHVSSMDAPAGFGTPPGTDPRFFLSSEDVYRFLHGFALNDTDSAAFDDAVQSLYRALPPLALEADMAESTTEQDHFEQVLRMFGALSGLQHEARLDVRGRAFGERHAAREALASGWAALGLLPLEATRIIDTGWRLIQFGAAGKLNASDPDPRDELEAAHRQAATLQRCLVAITMVRNGYPYTEELPPELLDERGQLLGTVEISTDLSEGGLAEQLIDWAHDNVDRHPEHTGVRSFDNKFGAGWDAIGNGRNDASTQVVDRTGW
ncbi:hypothetical protein [Phytoactinopolyspora endophytica]|uniref:hypothetical protein n=1 Tax=Phytoactinopolyspora endophytica TaxID=1642495 RepID=UPI00101DB625|nr:hypothetical protein [Phytoactinopolyspora endophytica]